MRKLFLAMFLGSLGLGLLATPSDAHAQRRAREPQNLDRILIIPPKLGEGAIDTVFVMVLADEARKRLAGRARNQVKVVETAQYCEALEASGFDCGTLLDDNSAAQLARFLNADAYVVSTLSYASSTPSLVSRAVDLRRSGVAGWSEVEGAAAATDFGKAFGDSLRNQIRAGGDAKQCTERRDRSDFDGAKNRANRAFEMYPNHPAAAMCLSYIFEADTDMPAEQKPDSLIWAYRKAVAGDFLMERAWERLGQQLLLVGDTAGAIEAFIGQLAADPGNEELRRGIVAQQILLGDFETALELLEEGIALNPASIALMQLKARTCTDGALWDCAVDAFEAQYALNNEMGSDTIFLQQVIGAADLAADTVANIRWTGIAYTSFPDRESFGMAHGAALRDGSMTDSALAIFTGVAESHTSNTRAPLAMVQIHVEGLAIDSTTPLDTATMMTIDSLLQNVTALAQGDDATRATIGALYLQPGIKLAQLRLHPRTAADWLAKGLEYPIQPSLATTANFFLGFSTVFYLGDLFAEVQAAESCDAVADYEMHVLRGKNALVAGRSLSESTAEALLANYTRFEDVIPQFKAAWSCGTGN